MGEYDACRRSRCTGVSIARGLCALHWGRWQDGAEELNQSDDRAPAPPRQVWWPPKRSKSASAA